MTCPNIGGFETTVLGKESDTVDHEHLNLFNTTSIKTIFDTTRNYFLLEDDKDSPFKKITSTGDVVGTLEFATDGDKKTDSAEDKSISGKYMVTAIRHIFSQPARTDPKITYTMKVEVTKDGLEDVVQQRSVRNNEREEGN